LARCSVDISVQSGTEDEQRDAALYRCVGLLKDSRLAAIRFYQLSVELFPLDRSNTFNLFDLQVGRYRVSDPYSFGTDPDPLT
jgi:hypothetical protein